MFYPSAVPGELNHGIITARARRYDAEGKMMMGMTSKVRGQERDNALKARGEELGLRALASRLGVDVVDDQTTVITADNTLLHWYVELEEQIPQGVIDVITKERQRFDPIYHCVAVATPSEED